MTSISAKLTGSSHPNPNHRAQTGSARFILTLCTLAAPVSIRPPQSPRLKPFTFFMSRAREPNGSERLYLNMGYFETLAEAEGWAESVRRHYPSAYATVAPLTLLRPSEGPSLSLGASHPVVAQTGDPAPVKDESLTDTQVLEILGKRRVSTVQNDVDERHPDQVTLLRPDDTGIRQALKEAVVQGAPVSFAVQLQWSTRPIDLSRVRSLPIFKTYILYATESRRKGRSHHFLRLGFFADPISAKDVAVQVRSNFASAAVVPVVDPEISRAREAGMSSPAIPYLAEQRLDGEIESNGVSGLSTQRDPFIDALRRVPREAETVEQTVELPAERELWTEPDSLSESGVRHLKVEVQEHLSGRWKIVRLSAAPLDMA